MQQVVKGVTMDRNRLLALGLALLSWGSLVPIACGAAARPPVLPPPIVPSNTPQPPAPAPARPSAPQPATAPPAAAPAASAQPAPPAAAPVANAEALATIRADADAELAERLVDDAQDTLHLYNSSEALWRKSVAEIKAAMRLKPDEPRYPRLLAEALTELGDTNGVIGALTAYREVLARQKLDDQIAQVRLIDLYLGQMETVDARLSYLKTVLGMTNVPPEVQAHAAVQAVPLLMQRSVKDAEGMVQQAVRLDPLNFKARLLENQMVGPNGVPVEQLQSMLALLRANPTYLPAMAGVARALAGSGLNNESLPWFLRAAKLEAMTGVHPDMSLRVDYAAQFYLAGVWQSAADWAESALQGERENVNARFMVLSLVRETGKVLIADQALGDARRLLDEQVRSLARRVQAAGMGGAPGAAAGDVDSAVQQVNKGGVPIELKLQFLASITDVAWFAAYYDHRAADANRWVAVLEKLVPADDVTLLRLKGWSELAAGNMEKAKAILAPLQDRDALSALGMVDIMVADAGAAARVANRPALPATRPATAPAGGLLAPGAPPARVELPSNPTNAAALARADALGMRLLEQNRTGLLAVIIASELRERHLQPKLPPFADAMRNELSKSPTLPWLDILEHPEKFYLMIGRPLRIKSHKLGDAMIAKVTIQNASNYDIPIGLEGAIKPDLWFDAEVGVAQAKKLQGAVYDKIANVLVLKAHTGTDQTVRINQGKLGEMMQQMPSATVNLWITALTNPVARGHTIEPGPIGVRRRFLEQFIRTSAPVANDSDKAKIYRVLSGQPNEVGLPGEKMQALQLLTAYVLQSREKGADGRVIVLAPEMQEQMARAREDSVPQVAAWATFQAAVLADGPAREKLLATLEASPQWSVRMLALMGADSLDPAAQKRIAAKLANDPDPDVKAAAAAQLQLADKPPTRRVEPQAAPTSQPAPATPTPEKAPEGATPGPETAPASPSDTTEPPAAGPKLPE